jgi:hypothetical protein
MTGSLPQGPLPGGMIFVVPQHTKVASQFSVHQAALSLAAQSIIGHLPVDVP